MNGNVPAREFFQVGGHRSRACARSACQCLAGASFPYLHLYLRSVKQLDKFNVGPFRKNLMLFYHSSIMRHREVSQAFNKYDRMGVPHRDTSNLEFLIPDMERIIDNS